MLDLTVPRSVDTLRGIVSAGLKRLRADFERSPSHPALDAVKRALASLPPGLVWSSLRRTNVATMVRVLRDRWDPELANTLAATLALELAHAGAELPPLSFDRTPPIVCLGARRLFAGGPATLRDGAWSAGTIDAPPFTSLTRGRIVLTTADDNPLAMVEAHPDKFGNAVDLGGRSRDEWRASLEEALAIVETHLPALYEEIELLIERIVPVGYDDHKHLSASYREAIGTIYLTLHPSVMTMAEALIHEHSHNKLNAAMELDPILTNAFEPLYASPVRPDPRPLHGVLLAVHAFLPVAELYRTMIAAGDTRARPDRYAKIIEGNREGAAVLAEHAKGTPYGRRLLEEIATLDASYIRDFPRGH
jgi:HEXXH motif-containing protein